ATFVSASCSPDGWCWLNPLHQGNDLYFARGMTDGSVVLAGVAGSLLRCMGSVCTSLNSGTLQRLLSVWGNDAVDLYAVGDGGTVVRCVAGSNSCTPLITGILQVLTSVWGSDTGNVYAVGNGGMVLRCAAGSNSCTPLPTGIAYDLWSVWG